MLRLLLQAYPQAVKKLGKGQATVMHLIASSRIDCSARRLRGGALEGEGESMTRRRRRGEMIKVALEYEHMINEFEHDLSYPRVAAWRPIPTEIKGNKDVGDYEQSRYRRALPCVALSLVEKAKALRHKVIELVQNRRGSMEAAAFDVEQKQASCSAH